MRQKAPREESLVDMEAMTLLVSVSLFMAVLAFFIMLCSYSVTSADKIKTLKNSIQNSFGFVITGDATAVDEEEGAGKIAKVEGDMASSLRAVLPDLDFQTRKTAEGQIMSANVSRAVLEGSWDSVRTQLGELIVNQTGGAIKQVQFIALDGPSRAGELAAYASTLGSEGVDNSKIYIGYENTGQDAVQLRFIIGKRGL
ncbi:MAG: hypothetical protein KGQ41_01345 [Alphaproteobacteria bacterium]|nr:hypothetical protein [Alphaproteobacteria bacterium]